MATNANIKDALTSGANIFNGGKIVGAAGLLRIQAWFGSDYAEQLDGASASANDISSWMWRQVNAQVKNYERKIAHRVVAEPDDLDDTA
jgi:hypothetical protein